MWKPIKVFLGTSVYTKTMESYIKLLSPGEISLDQYVLYHDYSETYWPKKVSEIFNLETDQ